MSGEEPRYGERAEKPAVPPATSKSPSATAGTWFWMIAIGAIVVAPLSIFLIRWALGAL